MKLNRGFSPLFLASTVIILLILLPVLTIVIELFKPLGEHWDHIVTFLLKDYVVNTVVLMVSVMIITSVIGTFLSWMITQYNYKFKGFLYLLFILPLAIPTYIGGYVYGGIFNFGGTIDRLAMKWSFDPIRVDILSIGGAIFVFSLFLMPYVFLATKAFFDRLPSTYSESSRILGKGPMATFYKVILPISRGAIFGGALLVGLEILNDYGLVQYFGIPTFSTAIFKTWFGLGDISSAIRLAAVLMVIVFVMISIEHVSRGKGKISTRSIRVKRVKAPKHLDILFKCIGAIYVLFALVIPVIQLIYWASIAKSANYRDIFVVFKNTFLLAGLATGIVLFLSLIVGHFNRLSKNWIGRLYAKIIVLGYSVPASIIAVAVLLMFISIENLLFNFTHVRFMSRTIYMLLFALVIRFMAIGFNNIDYGFKKVGTSYHYASRVLGKNAMKSFVLVDLPLIKSAVLSSCILTFVDVLKELPLTLILRPFNFDTLATKVFTYAGDEMIHEASIFALIIIGISSLSIIGLQLIARRKHV